MKLDLISLGLALVTSVIAIPATPVENANIADRAIIAKRAAITDSCSTGYGSINGGTTGGKGGSTTTVSTYAQFTAAAAADDTARIIIVVGTITKTADQVKVGSNKSIIGKNSAAGLVGFGLLIKSKKNVIIRNIAIKKVLADNGDAIGIQLSTNIWVDHVDLSSDRDHDKDYYDGLLDVTHAGDYVTVSNTFFHDHWKASLVGHSDSNSAEDTGHLRVTYHNNFWYNINSRTPSIRFGTGHFYNNFFRVIGDGINTRDGAQVLVQSNVFSLVDNPIYSTDAGYAVASDNYYDSGYGTNTALAGTLKTVPYSYSLLGQANVISAVYGTAGNTLSF